MQIARKDYSGMKEEVALHTTRYIYTLSVTKTMERARLILLWLERDEARPQRTWLATRFFFFLIYYLDFQRVGLCSNSDSFKRREETPVCCQECYSSLRKGRPTGRRTFLDAYFATLFLFIVVLNEGQEGQFVQCFEKLKGLLSFYLYGKFSPFWKSIFFFHINQT